MKKRFLAILLTVVMVLALAVPAAAYTVKETKLDTTWHYDTYVNPANAAHLVKTQHNGLYGYVNYQDIPVVQAKYTTLASFSEGVAVATKDGAYVYVDTTGKEVITLGVAKEAYNFSCGLARVVSTSGITYFIDHAGNSVFTCGANTAEDFEEVASGVYLAKVITPDGRIGLVNKQGVEIAHYWYDELRDFSDGLAYFHNVNGYQGFLNVNGVEVFRVANHMNVGEDVKIDGVTHGDYSNGMVIVENTTAPVDSRVGYLDTTGYQAVHCQYSNGWDFAGGIAKIQRGTEVVFGKEWPMLGYIDKANKYTVQPEYHVLERGTGLVYAAKYQRDSIPGGQQLGLEGNHVVVNTTSTWSNPYLHYGFVNAQNGTVVVPLVYTFARSFSGDGLAYVEKWAAKGFVNTAGVLVVNDGGYYDEMGDSYEGKAWVVKNGKWGYIATTAGGRLAIPMIYDVDGTVGYPNLTGLCNFKSGVAVACYGNAFTNPDKGHDTGRYGIIDASGNWLTANWYDWVDYMIYADRVALAQYGGGNKIRFVFY